MCHILFSMKAEAEVTETDAFFDIQIEMVVTAADCIRESRYSQECLIAN
ncbi:hypothetical protein [Adhaeretor mobilis]|uniref:Uncharacterized protein n=1 Tax=Adhaeretor mobilis TaxID=1930276 RepID=A0A517N1L6_9BACT|nr:hypothetical protein [Adhaeretor mobilis]QDT01030.1 hypothetical protein HG15A2_43720 [Adhaeretor mobilis]